MHDRAHPKVDVVVRQMEGLESPLTTAGATGTATLAGKRVKVNLYRRGIFRSCLVGTCSVLPGGVAILAETVLTSQRRCLSRFELGAKDVAAISPVQSLEADFELQLDLDCIEWQERIEKIPVPLVRRQSSIRTHG